jgi:hypothetical protein
MTEDEKAIDCGALFEVFKIREPSLNPAAWAELAKTLADRHASALAEIPESSLTPATWEKSAKALAAVLASAWKIQRKKSRRPGKPRILSSLALIKASNKVQDLMHRDEGLSEHQACEKIWKSEKLSKRCKLNLSAKRSSRYQSSSE